MIINKVHKFLYFFGDFLKMAENFAMPTVAIIGRPNVGKSTLFNAFIGKRKAIVSDIPGTTRDSLVEKISHLGDISYFLVDTAGLSDFGDNALENEIQVQAEVALENADCIMWVLDNKANLTQDDYEIADKLRAHHQKVFLVANKVDDGLPDQAYNFMELGFGMPEIVSAKNNFHFWDFVDALQEKLKELGFSALPEEDEEAEEDVDAPVKIAFVGRPNVGKSSLLNALIGKNRAVVSDVAGTTRDSLDEHLEVDGQKFTLIDTAGIRKRGKIEKNFEFWSSVRSRRAIEEADICAVLIDALDGVTHQDMALMGEAIDAGKGIILCVNKLDLMQEKTRADADRETDDRELDEVKMWGERLDKVREKYLWYLKNKISFLSYAPVLFFSAKTGKGVQDVFESAKGIMAERRKRISTAELNRFIPEVYYGHVAPMIGNKKGKIKMASQVDTCPPKFIFFVNNAAAFHFSYKRYLENKLREKYSFFGTPITVEFRDSMDKFRGRQD